ncbi:hypothetical protein JTB14_032102 [Gonioctena quinquepunctata]|nr:hypothetical protein JTB14_032102 [Gonioctena quinquepunctata]
MHLREGARSLPYADDMAVSIAAEDIHHLWFITTELNIIGKWIEKHDFRIAIQKTGEEVLKSIRKRETVIFRIKRTTRWHTTETAQKKTAMLTRLLPNEGESSSIKTLALYGVASYCM